MFPRGIHGRQTDHRFVFRSGRMHITVWAKGAKEADKKAEAEADFWEGKTAGQHRKLAGSYRRSDERRRL
ncbi:hypothetical protein IE4771_PB00065 (plasmid) [Rhizobium etli bv. mimosae str. IE4771]|uniref:Uncharacterized protein n=1 Tax=Rhizobium etli bv. mimosae str. IE4771 TaxID=1432050 RepID=A0A060ICK2_RHIET|nr:hypothetical protein IE4771_PB00065 [Rhizobium sp. IE4771]